jgi:hypothetical protein
VRRASILALLLTLALPAAAERVPCPLGTAGLALEDVSVALVEESATPPAEVALPGGVALVETAPGHYTLTGLPDVEPEADTWYSLTISAGAVECLATWPTRTLTPSELVAAPLVTQLVGGAGQRDMVAGDTAPDVELQVFGLSADPDGASVDWELFSWTGTALATTGTATVTGTALDDGSWMASLVYRWAAADTADRAGELLWGRFALTLPGGEVLTRPAAPRTISVKVHP